MTQLEQADRWLKAMREALDNKDKSRALELDDINQESQFDWALMPQDLSDRYDAMTRAYLDLVLYT